MKTCNGRAIGLLVGKKSKDRDRRKGKEREGDRERYGTTGGKDYNASRSEGGDVVSCEWGWQIYIMVKPPWEKRTNTGILSGKMSNPP